MNNIKMMDNKFLNSWQLKEIKKNKSVKNFSFVGYCGDLTDLFKQFKIDLADNSAINIFVKVN